MFDDVGILSGTSIAATSCVIDGSAHLRVYTQDKEYVIRETRFDEGSWSGGTSEDILIQAKPKSPIAALIHGATSSGLRVRVYYITEDNFVRERAKDNEGTWIPGDLDHLNIKAAPNSRLAVIGETWGDSSISLYYQKPDGAIAEVRWEAGNRWVEGDTIVDKALLGTGLAAVTFHTTKETGIRVYYQIADGTLAEAHIDKGGKWYPAGGIPKITDVASATNIAAYAHGVEAPNLEVQYLSKNNVLSEYRYYEDAWYGKTLPDQVTALPGSGIALIQVQDYLSLKSYIQVEENRIQELYWEKGFADWKKGATLPPQNA